MNRQLWSQYLTQKGSPAYQCPECGKGIFTLVPASLIFNEESSSKRARLEAGGDSDWIVYLFSAWLKCSYAICGGRATEFEQAMRSKDREGLLTRILTGNSGTTGKMLTELERLVPNRVKVTTRNGSSHYKIFRAV
jgi:hypothetical protein